MTVVASAPFAQTVIDCGQAANAERSECLALPTPTMSTQGGPAIRPELWIFIAGIGWVLLGQDGGGGPPNTNTQ
ncbi:hypothetical protein [Roseisalinus antarcticus]|uniref:hypothetical protein n=1 Tax=Roseisalinus antarcticus TaxID=254357 RepID=UPI000A26CC46|nr:hypothetical protein [Roseisalinus antarcticus]